MDKRIIAYLKEELDDDTYIPPFYFPQSEKKDQNDILISGGEKELLLKNIEDRVKVCKKCRLGFSRINAVFGMGNPYSKVMFVGEGPGWEEDHQGLPFVGKAGQLLDKILSAIGLDRSKVYIANVVKCHPMINPQTPHARANDRPPVWEEIEACREYIEKQIEIIKPLCIVALGNTATKFFLPSAKGVSQVRGRFHIVENFCSGLKLLILPTYHPAALLRNPSLKKETWQDMKILRDFLQEQR